MVTKWCVSGKLKVCEGVYVYKLFDDESSADTYVEELYYKFGLEGCRFSLSHVIGCLGLKVDEVKIIEDVQSVSSVKGSSDDEIPF